MRIEGMPPRSASPVPPGEHRRHAGHHWLWQLDHDGHSHGMIVLQWNPVQGTWHHSDTIAALIRPRDTRGWAYVAPAPLPDYPSLAEVGAAALWTPAPPTAPLTPYETPTPTQVAAALGCSLGEYMSFSVQERGQLVIDLMRQVRAEVG